MPHSISEATCNDLLLQLLQVNTSRLSSTGHLARLDSAALDYLHTTALNLHDRAVDESRYLLDVVLEVLESPLSLEHQRRLIERADDQLASAQRWGELAANARFCLQRPELAQQLAGDARAAGSDDAAGDGGKRSRGRERSVG